MHTQLLEDAPVLLADGLRPDDRDVQVQQDRRGEDRRLDVVADLLGYLGRSFYEGDAFFQGWYDNIRVYSRSLSATEILGNAGVDDQLIDVPLSDPSALKIAPIANSTARTAVLPVNRD
ncbi:LamG domain-containing protein [Microbacterium aurantiacum]|uniref:LamG domain-containing protein n=1 Tax=Microbacterium aurantiacum TaxID=162393 RepID=UPI001F34945A|nr:LamG domain-containing protein [Microbacterium aurantiacum]